MKSQKENLFSSKWQKLSLLSLIFLMVSCAGQAVRVNSNTGVKLSNYRTILLEFSTKVADSDSELDQLESQVTSGIKREGLFEKIFLASGNPDAKTDLTLRAELIGLNKVSAAARFIGGAFAGRAKAIMNVKVLENSSGRELFAFQAEGKTGAWSMAGSTDQAIRLTSKQIVDYLKNNL